jgi:putative SOS response-associated peptidase YedK
MRRSMPLFIHKEDIDTWLTGTREQATQLIKPYPSELMRAHPVSTRVNSPKNNDTNLVECV